MAAEQTAALDRIETLRVTSGARHMKSAVALALVLFAGTAASRCIDVHQELQGVVQDSIGEPLKGAIVMASWFERGEVVTVTEQSGPDGRFNLHIIFNAFSGAGLAGEDRCEGKFEKFALLASKDGFISGWRRLRPSKGTISVALSLEEETSD